MARSARRSRSCCSPVVIGFAVCALVGVQSRLARFGAPLVLIVALSVTLNRARCQALLLTEPSVRDNHEPAPLVEHLTSAKLTDEFGSREGMPVHGMA
jgi:hypothetical protein